MKHAAPPLPPPTRAPLPSGGLPGVQPGGGWIQALERAWGRARRALLRRFRPGYVARMRDLRVGECPGCPHDVVDPRDLKLVRNACGYAFPEHADRFAWRGRLGIARQGWAEILVSLAFCVALGVPLALLSRPAVLLPLALAVWAVAFFRDPERVPPADERAWVAPADGLVDDVTELPDGCEGVPGPAVRVGIFLSLFNVHVNRAPCAAEVLAVDYRPGLHRATYRRGALAENECCLTWLRPRAGPEIVLVRQIAGPAARRIVNELRPGAEVARGARFGLIKFGSRTELYVPRGAGLVLQVAPGVRVRAGESVLARIEEPG